MDFVRVKLKVSTTRLGTFYLISFLPRTIFSFNSLFPLNIKIIIMNHYFSKIIILVWPNSVY